MGAPVQDVVVIQPEGMATWIKVVIALVPVLGAVAVGLLKKWKVL